MLLGRGQSTVPGFDGEPDLEVVERNGMACLLNRPLSAIAPPGMTVRAHDWAHADSSAEFVDKPMPLQKLLRKTMTEQLAVPSTESQGQQGDHLKLQQMALLVAASASTQGIALNGMRKTEYVQDALDVLKMEPLSKGTLKQLLQRFRSLSRELGGDGKGLWS
ncbi:unnamed protein product [Amoebophrya sp. A25]|nr:unnamed protein product [Amoebophrya sp. A25]|eukprot:GSA25T00015761001.1